MVIEPSMLIIGDDKQGLLPQGRRSQGLIDILVVLLAESDVVIGVLIVAAESLRDVDTVAGVDP